MLKTIKKSLPASHITKKAKKISIVRNERSSKRNIAHDPFEISKRLNRKEDHFILYPTLGGYRFSLFSRLKEKDPFEILAVSHKAYKLKSEAVKVMKRMLRSLGLASMSDGYIFAFDPKGNRISLKIEYDIKMLL